MVTDWRQAKRVSFYFYYWSIYLAVFSIVEGIPANALGAAFLGELATLLPKIIFVTLVTEWLFEQFPIQRYPLIFSLIYSGLLLPMAFILRLADNYVVIPYLLPHWHKEPLLSAAPFLYNVIKLQFVATIPVILRITLNQKNVIADGGKKNETDNGASPSVSKETADTANAYLNITSDRRLMTISLADVLYFETRGNQILIYTETDCFKTYLSISKLQEQLTADMFVRVHRSFIVPLSKISWFSTTIVAVGETKIPIGRAYSEATKRVLSGFN